MITTNKLDDRNPQELARALAAAEPGDEVRYWDTHSNPEAPGWSAFVWDDDTEQWVTEPCDGPVLRWAVCTSDGTEIGEPGSPVVYVVTRADPDGYVDGSHSIHTTRALAEAAVERQAGAVVWVECDDAPEPWLGGTVVCEAVSPA